MRQQSGFGGGTGLHAGEREARHPEQVSDAGTGRVPALGFAVTPQELILQVDGKFTHYPLTAESAVALAADLLKMASWAMRK